MKAKTCNTIGALMIVLPVGALIVSSLVVLAQNFFAVPVTVWIITGVFVAALCGYFRFAKWLMDREDGR